MSLKHNIVFLILGFFIIKIGIIDNARNFHRSPANKVVNHTPYYEKGIR